MSSLDAKPTHLMLAAAYDDADWMQKHASKFDPLGQPEGSPSALLIAAEKGHARCVEILLRSKPAEQCAAAWSANKWRPIELATRAGHAAVVKALRPWEPQASMGRALSLASKMGRADMLATLLAGVDASTLGEEGRRAFLEAIEVEDNQAAELCAELWMAAGMPARQAGADGPERPVADSLFAAIAGDNPALLIRFAREFDLGELWHVRSHDKWVGRRTPLIWAVEHSRQCAELLVRQADERTLRARATAQQNWSIGGSPDMSNRTALQAAQALKKTELADAIAYRMAQLNMPLDTQSERVAQVRLVREQHALRAIVTQAQARTAARAPASLDQDGAANGGESAKRLSKRL
jgi:hypothetical protein